MPTGTTSHDWESCAPNAPRGYGPDTTRSNNSKVNKPPFSHARAKGRRWVTKREGTAVKGRVQIQIWQILRCVAIVHFHSLEVTRAWIQMDRSAESRSGTIFQGSTEWSCREPLIPFVVVWTQTSVKHVGGKMCVMCSLVECLFTVAAICICGCLWWILLPSVFPCFLGKHLPPMFLQIFALQRGRKTHPFGQAPLKIFYKMPAFPVQLNGFHCRKKMLGQKSAVEENIVYSNDS